LTLLSFARRAHPYAKGSVLWFHHLPPADGFQQKFEDLDVAGGLI
jgi:hypothetical protein